MIRFFNLEIVMIMSCYKAVSCFHFWSNFAVFMVLWLLKKNIVKIRGVRGRRKTVIWVIFSRRGGASTEYTVSSFIWSCQDLQKCNRDCVFNWCKFLNGRFPLTAKKNTLTRVLQKIKNKTFGKKRRLWYEKERKICWLRGAVKNQYQTRHALIALQHWQALTQRCIEWAI